MGFNETRPRGPIAAQYKSPGPIYNLPGLVGSGNHDPRSVHEQKPAYSFGTRHGKYKDDASPGPIYLPDLRYSRYGQDFSPRYSIYSRPKDLKASTRIPGPGAYSPEKQPVVGSPRAPAYSFGSRTDARKIDKNPGPNHYNVPSLLSKSCESTHRQAPAYTQVGRSIKGGFHEDLGKTPGPGHYSVTTPNVYKQKGPEYSITGRTPVVTDNTRKPGPGAHSPEKVTATTGTGLGPSFSFGVRHSQFVAPVLIDADD